MSPRVVAALPMYDFPSLRAAHDAFWHALASRLTALGVAGVPGDLSHDLGHLQLWGHEGLLFGQACEYPLSKSFADRVRVLATPCYAAAGCEGSSYRSAIVVRTEDPAQSLAELRGMRCALNEPDSNSGMNLLRVAIAPFAGAGPFFAAVTLSGSHRRSAIMVANQEADVAALDCVTLAHLQREQPRLTASLRVLGWTPASPCLPFITSKRQPEHTVHALRTALQEALLDETLAGVRARLFLTGADFEVDEAFTRVRDYERQAADLGYPQLR